MRATLLFALLTGCPSAPVEPPPPPGALAPTGATVMTVNGEVVGQNMLEAVTMRVPPEQMARMRETPEQMKQFLDQLALGQALYQRAIAEKLYEQPHIEDGTRMAAREFLAGMYVQRKAAAAVTEEAVRKYYEDRKVQYAQPQVRARHILVAEESKANDLKKQVEGGADFAVLATEHSTDKGSADMGGDVGWFEKGRMVEEFSDAAFAAAVGDLVGPVATRFGFHLIKVEDKRDTTPLEEVRDRIEASLRQEAVQGVLDEVKREMKVELGAGVPGAPTPTPPPAPAPGGDPATANPAAPTPAPAGGQPEVKH